MGKSEKFSLLQEAIILQLREDSVKTRQEIMESVAHSLAIRSSLYVLEKQGLVKTAPLRKGRVGWYLTEAGEDAVAGVFKKMHNFHSEAKADE